MRSAARELMLKLESGHWNRARTIIIKMCYYPELSKQPFSSYCYCVIVCGNCHKEVRLPTPRHRHRHPPLRQLSALRVGSAAAHLTLISPFPHFDVHQLSPPWYIGTPRSKPAKDTAIKAQTKKRPATFKSSQPTVQALTTRARTAAPDTKTALPARGMPLKGILKKPTPPGMLDNPKRNTGPGVRISQRPQIRYIESRNSRK